MAGVLAGVLVLCGGVVAAGVIVFRTVASDETGGGPTEPGAQAAPTGPIDWLLLRSGSPAPDAIWGELADEFVATNGTEVDLAEVPSADYSAMLSTRLHAGDPPDLYYSAGGNRLRGQVEAGLVRDLTDDLADVIATMPPGILTPYTVDGRIYGLPYHIGTLGIWYNRALFADADLDPDTPPRTWNDFLAAVASLKADGTTPVALAGVNNWPGLFWYGYLATRVAGVEAFVQAGAQRSLLENPDFLRAAELLDEFIQAEPFQPGYETATYAEPGGQADLIATGEAAMELMGGWAPGLHEATAPGGLGDDLGWFPFPAVEGGSGGATELYGGADGFVVGAEAPEATIDFLRFLFSDESYQRLLAADEGLTSVRGDATAPADDPNLQRQLTAIQNAPATQLYLDADLPSEASIELLEGMGQLLAGTATPQETLARVTDAWQAAPDY